jgi:hypothetical protein
MAKKDFFVAIVGEERKGVDMFKDFEATRLNCSYFDRKTDAEADEKVIIGVPIDFDSSDNKMLMTGEVGKLHFDLLNQALVGKKPTDAKKIAANAKKIAATLTLPLIGMNGQPVVTPGEEAIVNDEFLFARINGTLVAASKN